MKKMLKSVTLVVACLTVASGQQAETRTGTTAHSQASTSANRDVSIQSGTHIRGALQSTLDARNAKVGDPVVLKTTEAIKSDGRKVANKGSKLFGHVTDVTRKTKSNGASQISILFDTVQDGSLTFPITATISSITSNSVNARLGDDNQLLMESNARGASSASGGQPSGGGGPLGGLTNTVGGTVNSSTATVGGLVGATTGATNSVVAATGSAAGASTRAVTGSLGRIQINESTNASTSGSSVLSLNGGNLRLEKGTTFDLVVGQSGQAETTKQP